MPQIKGNFIAKRKGTSVPWYARGPECHRRNISVIRCIGMQLPDKGNIMSGEGETNCHLSQSPFRGIIGFVILRIQ